MMTLIRTEWLKMRKYNAFWWIIGLTALSYPGINYMLFMIYQNIVERPDQLGQYAKMGLGNPFSFPEVWHSIAYFSSWFVFIPSIVIIMFISNEYTFKTHRQNVIDGWSRSQFVTSKLIDVFLVSAMITILYTLVSLVAGFASQERLIQDTWGQSYYIGLFFLQTFAQLSLAFLVGFVVRKAFLALGIFLFYSLILENFLATYLQKTNSPIAPYFPMELSDRIIPPPGFLYIGDPLSYQRAIDAIPLHITLTTILTAIVWFICYLINNKRDLK